ncbi:hypothetical protein HPP92_009067 [Vanilla planifolia]|uniref:Uncharacterized protein n=1 Tax=Vanilla planifolia TaxID=51239 RepID=A0A835V530_VANPL|nr:hypothetical protein HPP92_009067 [Vanilla planifolia]
MHMTKELLGNKNGSMPNNFSAPNHEAKYLLLARPMWSAVVKGGAHSIAN